MDTEAARQALSVKRADAVERLRGLDASFADIVESARDSNLDDEHDTEGTTIAASRAQVSSLAEAARKQIEDVDRALLRLESGDYSRCATCGARIADARLEARPEATTCIDCARGSSSGARR